MLKLFELKQYKDDIENAWYNSFTDEQLVEQISKLIDESKKVYELCNIFNLKYIDVYDLNNQMNEILNEIHN